MSTILKTIVRVIQGKQPFDPPEVQQNGPQPPLAPVNEPWMQNIGLSASVEPPAHNQTEPQEVAGERRAEPHEPTINRNDSRTFPIVRVKHTTTRHYNGEMEVSCRIINESPFRIDVHKAELLETVRDIRYPLGPGQEKDFLLYHGRCMHDTAHHEMGIEYKTENGVYFKSIHDVRYHINPDRTFSVDDLHLRLPIRHIAG